MIVTIAQSHSWKGQRLLPIQALVSPEINRITQIVRGEEQREADRDGAIDPPRARHAHRDPKSNRDENRQEDGDEMAESEDAKDRFGIHAAGCGADSAARSARRVKNR